MSETYEPMMTILVEVRDSGNDVVFRGEYYSVDSLEEDLYKIETIQEGLGEEQSKYWGEKE
jgi:hypothetical protein